MASIKYIANIRLPTEKAHGIQIMKTCEALARQGVELELIVPRRLNCLKGDPFEFYGVERKFKIVKLWCLDLVSLNIFGALGFRIESLTFYLALKFHLGKQASVVCYTRDFSIAYWLSKIVNSVYYEIHVLPEKVGAKYKEAWNRCKGLIVISDELKNELVRRGINNNKILVARDAVDLKMFENLPDKIKCRQKLKLPIDKRIVVYSGHLYGWKGADALAMAASLLPEDALVCLVGGMVKDVKKFRKKFQFSNLKIIGWRPLNEIPVWLKAADILVLPTSAKEKIGALYTSPMKMFEYMAAKRPIVASDIPSSREVLDETTALLFSPDSAPALAQALMTVDANYSEAEVRAVRAHELVTMKYSWEKRAKDIMEFIQIGV